MTARTTRRAPMPRWHGRLAAAGTPAEELTVAYDRLRRELARACRPQRDTDAATRSAQLAADVARYATDLLNAAAERLEGDRQ